MVFLKFERNSDFSTPRQPHKPLVKDAVIMALRAGRHTPIDLFLSGVDHDPTFFSLLIRTLLLAAGVLIVIAAAVGVSIGLGYLATLLVPLDLFQATVVVGLSIGATLLIIQSLFIVSVSDKLTEAAAGRSKNKISQSDQGRFKNLNRKIQNSPCPCGSGKKVKECCGANS